MKIVKPTHEAAGHRNGYCGPAALSIITGMTCEEAARRIREQNGRRAVRGTHLHELTPVLKDNGFKTSKRIYALGVYGGKPTLTRWLKQTRKTGKTYIVCVAHHWIVVRNRTIGDNQQGLVSVRESKHRRKRVRYWVEVEETEHRKANRSAYLALSKSRPSPVAQRTTNPMLLKLRKICQRLGVKVRELIDLRSLNAYGVTELDLPNGYRYSECACMTVFSVEDAVEYLENMEPVTEVES